MTAIELYKFIHEESIEFRWEGDDVIIWVSVWLIEDFNDLFGTSSILDNEGGIECGMQYKCFWFMMGDLCEFYGIELEEIFKKGSN